MLRPRKKHTVFDLQQLKGQRVLTHIHIKSPEEAAAAEEAGVDLMSCSFDSPEAQARLPALVAAAPHSFLSCATPHGLASPEEAIRVAFRALELGASSVYCSASPFIIEAMARERIPVVGHLGLVPRHVTWTGYRAIGRTVEEATQLYHRMKELENAGAYAAELEVVPHNLARFLSSQTKMLLMSLGSGPDCDTQFLFSDDILGDYDERPRATPKPTATSPPNTAASSRNASPPSANTSPTCRKAASPSAGIWWKWKRRSSTRWCVRSAIHPRTRRIDQCRACVSRAPTRMDDRCRTDSSPRRPEKVSIF